MNLSNLKLGQSIAALKPTDLNTIGPPEKMVREALLTNTRLDNTWTYLSQLGVPVESFIFSRASDDHETKSVAKIILAKDYRIDVSVSFIEPLHSLRGKAMTSFKLFKGSQLLGEGGNITDLHALLMKLPIKQKGIITQSEEEYIPRWGK